MARRTAEAADPSSGPVGARLEARACAAHLRLSLQQRTWRGSQGNWAGAGTGSSIDFQDHRPYLPGDDPRYIDWAAYARSGQTIMKLYREEVSPRLDLVLDVSRSMRYDPAKRDQTLRLFLFCLESALSIGAAPRALAVEGRRRIPLPAEALAAPDWTPPEPEGDDAPPDLERAAFRLGSLRVLVSDLLFEAEPADLLRPLTARRGRGVVLAPCLAAEERPDWSGNLELVDCERRVSRRQRVDAGLRKRYRAAYARHFESWADACRRHDVRFARVPCDVPLAAALEAGALRSGVVEAWG